MVELLGVADPKIVDVALQAVENILRVGKQEQEEQGLAENPIVALVEQAGGLQKIEQLQEDPNQGIYERSMGILESYFPLEEDGAIDENTPAGGFAFGAEVPHGGFQFGAQA